MPLLRTLYRLPARLAPGHRSLTVLMACRNRDQHFVPHKRPSQQVNTWKSFTLHKVGLHRLCVLIIPPPISLTDDEGLLGLSSVLVVPGGPASCVDGPFGRAQEGRLGLALAGGPLPGREACADRLEEPVQRSIPTAARKKHYTV